MIRHRFAPKLELSANSVTFCMIKIEGGSFNMGATKEQDTDFLPCERPVHRVDIKTFYIAETVVTQKLWMAVMGKWPEIPDFYHENYAWSNEDYPMVCVSKYDIDKFIYNLQGLIKIDAQFGLPSEAEWEYAARNEPQKNQYKFSGSNNIDDVAWYKKNSNGNIPKVKLKMPNERGIYDMSGGIMEFCQDTCDFEKNTHPYPPPYSNNQFNLLPYSYHFGNSGNRRRIIRGGAYDLEKKMCRITYRQLYDDTGYWENVGFRMALHLPCL